MEWKSLFPAEDRFFVSKWGILYNGNVLNVLKRFPSESIDCVITSPPYWGLRFYGKKTVSVWDGSPNCNHEWDSKVIKISLSPSDKSRLCSGKGANPKLKKLDGECETGFCKKCGAWKGQLGLEPTVELYIKHLTEIFDEVYRILKPTGTFWLNVADSYQNKSLMLVPERIVIALSDRGWKVRNIIIWHKPNAMPESVKDRFTNDYEFIFFLTKSDKYYFKQILEPYTAPLNRWGGEKLKAKGESMWDKGTGQKTYRDRLMRPNPEGKNKRAVWSISTVPTPYSHFAVFPEKIPELCIEAGCPENGIVLDPFLGSGTTAVTAEKNGRKWIGVEINEEYCKIAVERIKNTTKYLW